jgi:hypothetical protein
MDVTIACISATLNSNRRKVKHSIDGICLRGAIVRATRYTHGAYPLRTAQAMARAIRNAAVAARPPVSVVWIALFSGRAPV